MSKQIEMVCRASLGSWGMGRKVELRVMKFNYPAATVHVGELTMTQIPDGADCRPTMELIESQAQQLMDDLWQCGVRPAEGSGSAGQLTSVQYHLEDMRKIAFDVIALRREAVATNRPS